jgi:hypothetical protein
MSLSSIVSAHYLNEITPLYVYNKSEVVSNEIRRTQTFFEITFLDYIRTKYPEHKGIIDIGSNIGNHSLFFSKYLKNDIVYCFEPFPDNVKILEQNMSNSKSKIFDIALSDHIGELPLYNSQHDNNGGFFITFI